MASIFGLKTRGSGGFRTRNPDRDNATDIDRHKRLTDSMEQIADEIEAERNGLEARYRREVQDAGFLVDGMESDGLSQEASARAEELTRSILLCEKRLAVLTRQIALLGELRDRSRGLVESEWTEASEPERLP